MSRYLPIVAPLALAVALALPQTALAQEIGVATPAAAFNVADFAGKSLYGPKGERIGAIYKVTDQGVAQLIIDGKVRAVPSDSLSVSDSKLTTSLTKKQLAKGR